MRKSELLSLTSVAARTMGLALHAGPVRAADAEAAQLQEIVVTAEKRASTEQKTAIAMSVITPDTLQKNGSPASPTWWPSRPAWPSPRPGPHLAPRTFGASVTYDW